MERKGKVKSQTKESRHLTGKAGKKITVKNSSNRQSINDCREGSSNAFSAIVVIITFVPSIERGDNLEEETGEEAVIPLISPLISPGGGGDDDDAGAVGDNNNAADHGLRRWWQSTNASKLRGPAVDTRSLPAGGGSRSYSVCFLGILEKQKKRKEKSEFTFFFFGTYSPQITLHKFRVHSNWVRNNAKWDAAVASKNI